MSEKPADTGASEKKPRKPRGLPAGVTSVRVPAEMIEGDSGQDGEVPAVTPNALVRLAVEKDLDVERLAKLLDLQMRWEQENARKAFFAALSKFQSELPPILRVDKIDAGRGGRRVYASLGTINEAIRPHLYSNGLSFRFRQSQTPQGISVTCIVSHRDGHSEETTLTAGADASGAKNAIQSVGSTVSYLQRYTVVSALGLTSVEPDDDGGASAPPQQPAPASQPYQAEIMADSRQVQEMLGLLKELFSTGDAATAWLLKQEGHVNHPSCLTALEAAGITALLLKMQYDKREKETPPPAPAEPEPPPAPGDRATKEQRDQIQDLTTRIYGSFAMKEHTLYLQGLGYGSANSLTAVQADDRIAVLRGLLDSPPPSSEEGERPF